MRMSNDFFNAGLKGISLKNGVKHVIFLVFSAQFFLSLKKINVFRVYSETCFKINEKRCCKKGVIFAIV